MTPVLFEVSITECETSKVTVQILSPKVINASFQIIEIEGEKEVRGVLYQSCCWCCCCSYNYLLPFLPAIMVVIDTLRV